MGMCDECYYINKNMIDERDLCFCQCDETNSINLNFTISNAMS